MSDANKMLSEALDRLVVDNMEQAADAVLRIFDKVGVNGIAIVVMPGEGKDGAHVVLRSTMPPDANMEVLDGLVAGMKAGQANAPQA